MANGFMHSHRFYSTIINSPSMKLYAECIYLLTNSLLIFLFLFLFRFIIEKCASNARHMKIYAFHNELIDNGADVRPKFQWGALIGTKGSFILVDQILKSILRFLSFCNFPGVSLRFFMLKIYFGNPTK